MDRDKPPEPNRSDMRPVGSYPKGASPYGVMDMGTGLAEWCADWYNANYYLTSPTRNPIGPSSGKYKVVRGSAIYHPLYSRCSHRTWQIPKLCDVALGFRVVATKPETLVHPDDAKKTARAVVPVEEGGATASPVSAASKPPLKRLGSLKITRWVKMPPVPAEGCPILSPDGSKVAYSSKPTADYPGAPWNLKVRNIEGTWDKTLSLPFSHPFHNSWSPDGKHLVISGVHYDNEKVENGGIRIWRVNVDNGDLLPLTPLQWWCHSAVFSADGKKIVFVRSILVAPKHPEKGAKEWIYTMTSDGKKLKRLAEGFLPRWSPDGKRIVFKRRIIYKGLEKDELWLMDSDGKRKRRILSAGEVFKRTWKKNSFILNGYAWFDDGRTLLVPIRRGGYDIWIVDVNGKIKEILRDFRLSGGTMDGKKFIIGLKGQLWVVVLNR